MPDQVTINIPFSDIILILKLVLVFNPKLEDLKVLRRSPDLFNNVKIVKVLQLIIKHILFYHIWGVAAILVK